MPGNHYQVELEQQPIELYKLLKIADLVSGGGEAKVAISQGYVLLNDELETQKRKKVYHGDIISFNEDIVELICHQPVEEMVKKEKKIAKPDAKPPKPRGSKSPSNKSKSNKGKKATKSQSNTPTEQKKPLGGRRSISF